MNACVCPNCGGFDSEHFEGCASLPKYEPDNYRDTAREEPQTQSLELAREELAAVLAEHREDPGYLDTCVCETAIPDELDRHYAHHLADALLASPALARVIREAKAEALREAAEWVAEHVGYPVEMSMPAHPAPLEFWDALVDHIHADATGRWHGNELSRDEVASWLDDEVGRSHRPRCPMSKIHHLDYEPPTGDSWCIECQKVFALREHAEAHTTEPTVWVDGSS